MYVLGPTGEASGCTHGCEPNKADAIVCSDPETQGNLGRMFEAIASQNINRELHSVQRIVPSIVLAGLLRL